MADALESVFKLYSIGIVVEDKARDSDFIKVYPSEVLPLTQGPIKEQKAEVKNEVPDASGVPRKADTKMDSTLVAKWLPGDSSNRMTSPDVYANETVLIYRFADTDEYYWRTIFREPTLRRLETVYYVYGNLVEPLKEFNKDTSYWFMVSTHDKKIQFHTSKCDKDPKEPYTYDIELDTGRGVLTIKDDAKNTITLTSKDGELKVVTNKQVVIETKEKIIMKTKDVEITGNLKVKGDTTLTGKVSVNGAMSTSGAVEIKGRMNAGVVACGGVTMIVP